MKLVFVTAPSDFAEELVTKVVSENLAACGTVAQGVVSVYRWQGTIERSVEAQIMLKTSNAMASRLIARIAKLHPYDVPEIVAVDAFEVHPAYALWVENSTQTRDDLEEM